MDEELLFAAALEKSSAADRRKFLDAACGSNRRLRERLDKLLDADAASHDILDEGSDPAKFLAACQGEPPPEPQPTLGTIPAASEESNDTSLDAITAGGESNTALAVPGYELGVRIGRGGMGDVYRARDLELDREVAVKVLQERYPINSPVAARFVVEARITGQLQHPGIPAVYRVAALADGRPFLAMKLIKGQTLDELLQAQAPLNSLALIEAIAQTLGYAHAHGVIHRDVKPANVMVGSFGEVQLMDWGLAKVLVSPRREQGVPADPETTTTQIRSVPGSHTQYGSILGTPSYMPPEQAGGEIGRVGPASDVFGLGALWCKLLTGEPPFTGSDAESVRRDAMRGRTEEALARLDRCGAEPEVVALCKQCLAFEPAERPAHGNVVARRVAALRVAAERRARQAELSQARTEVQAAEQGKRRRVLMAGSDVLGLVLLAGLGVSLWQMTVANTERDAKGAALEAETQARDAEVQARRRAFAALRSMTAEVVERKFAQGVVLTDDDKEFLRGVIAQFDAFAAMQGTDAESRAVRAEGRVRIGGIRLRLGELQEAERDFEEALQLRQQLAAEFPTRSDFRRELASSHNQRGVLLRMTGRLPEARQDYDQAISIQKELVVKIPNVPEIRQELAGSYANRGFVFKHLSQSEMAKQDYGAALGLRQQLVADFPKQADFRQDLAASHVSGGDLQRETGRLQEAAHDYAEALNMQKQLVAEFRNRPQFRQDLAMGYVTRGMLLDSLNQREEAAQHFNEALRIQRQLADEFPLRPQFRRELSGTQNSWGQLLRDTNRLREAVKHFDDALLIHQQLVADFPTRPEYRRELAGILHNRAVLRDKMNRRKEAEQDYDKLLDIRRQLVAEFPLQREFRQQLASTLNNRGNLLRETGRPEEAGKDFDEALNIRKQLVADLPDRPDLRNELAGTYANLAILRQQQGDGAAAKRLLLEGRPHHLAALQANGKHPAYRDFYRNHLNTLAQVHAGLLEKYEAVQCATTRSDVGWDPPADAYDAATFLGWCIPIVSKHAQLDAQQREEAAQFYADAALALLREAAGKGYLDAAKLASNAAFASLRLHPEFLKLVAEQVDKGK